MDKLLPNSKKYIRHGFKRGMVPNDLAIKDTGSPILILVCSVGVKKNNLFVDVKGYSAEGATWTIDAFSIDGNTAQFNGPWDELDDFISNKIYTGTEGKQYRILITLIDSDWNAGWVYAYVMRHGQGVYACKSQNYINDGETFKLFNQSTLKGIGLGQAFHVNTGKLKDRINAFMALSWNEGEYQPSWFPNFADDFRDDYFKQFEAEERVDVKDNFGRFQKTIWKPKFGAANHYFNTYCYNLAALEILADAFCRKALGLEALDWRKFWESAKSENIITKLKEALNQQAAHHKLEGSQDAMIDRLNELLKIYEAGCLEDKRHPEKARNEVLQSFNAGTIAGIKQAIEIIKKAG